MTASRFVGAVVAAQALAQIGAFALPALLPGYIARWSLSATEAGWLIGIFFAAYVLAVPVLVSLTDRVPAREIYLVGTALTAASHLGLALLADGFWTALDALPGPAAAFLFGGVAALLALVIGVTVMPQQAPHREPGRSPTLLLDFRPVLRNRTALAWIAGYTVDTWELAALRAWGVTFLAATIAWDGAPVWLPGPSAIFTAAGLLGIAVSVTGNEMAQRFGRSRVVTVTMGAGAVLALLTGCSALVSAPIAALCVLTWNAAIYLDSSALTTGTVQAADKDRRGATNGPAQPVRLCRWLSRPDHRGPRA